MKHKKQLAIKRRNDFVDIFARLFDIEGHKLVEVDKYIQEQLTIQEQIDLFKPTNLKLFESTLITSYKGLNLFSKSSRVCGLDINTLDKIIEKVKD